jgi:large subunit ribosomal protein L25
MASINFELEAEVRENIGRGASRRLRHADKVPAILYGAGEPAVSLIFDHNKLLKSLSFEAFYSHILTLKMGKKSEKVILKAVQRHPAKPRVMHIDLLRIRADQKLHMHIPLHFLGAENAPGVKDGGVISHGMSDVEVICLPADLPEYLEVDISNLALNGVIHLSEIKIPKGVEFAAFAHGVEGHDLPVVSIHMPRIEEEVVEAPVEEEASAEGSAAAAAPEATGEQKEGGAPAGDKGSKK